MRPEGTQFPRRDLLKGAVSTAIACSIGDVLSREGVEAAQSASGQAAADKRGTTAGPADLLLTNGKFVDGRGQVGTALTIKNGRIVNVGQARAVGAASRTIDLGGRTVVPGFFDAHVHYTRAGVNPVCEEGRHERTLYIVCVDEAF